MIKKISKILFLFLMIIFYINSNNEPIGLSNTYGICYENNLIQALYNIKPMTDFLKEKFRKNYYIKDSVADKYLKYLESYILSQDSNSISRENFCTSTSDLKVERKDFLDIAVFLEYILEGLLFKDLNKDSIKDLNYYSFPFNKIPKTKLTEMFFTIILNYNQTYKNSRVKLDSQFDFILKLPVIGDSLEACIEDFFLGKGQEKKSIIQASDILVIKLNLWDYFEDNKPHKKIDKAIDFPINNLNLSKYIDPEAPKDQNPIYDLISIVMHHDDTNKYTSYLKEDSNWYNCNDEHILKVSEDVIKKIANSKELNVNPTPYILFYKKRPNVSNIKYKEKITKEKLTAILKAFCSDEDINNYLKEKNTSLEDIVSGIDKMLITSKALLNDIQEEGGCSGRLEEHKFIEEPLINLIKLENYLNNLADINF